MLVKVTYPFFLTKGGRIYDIGDTVDVSASKAKMLARRNLAVVLVTKQANDGTSERLRAVSEGDLVKNGLDIVCDEKTPENPSETLLMGNLSALTVAELRTLAAERGMTVPKRVTKKRLIEMIGG